MSDANPIEQTNTAAGSDRLAKPLSFDARYGAGKKRGLVLGGGGIYFVAWQVAYLNGLNRGGVDLSNSDVMVGTSAGSVVASILGSGGLKRFGKQVDWLSRVPALVKVLAPAGDLLPSQLRAINVFRAAQDAEPQTVKAIGFAALAAHCPSAAEMRRNTSVAIATRGWTSPALHIVTTDCYTGERLVLDADSRVTSIRAAAASSAVPGIFSPQPIADRFTMDGGTSGSGTHCDVVAGARRALVISLGSVTDAAAAMTIKPGCLDRELAALADAGTEVIAKQPDIPVDITTLMSPAAVSDAIAAGEAQAAKDAADIAVFWNS